jgi:proteasome lid subunit RPN8/RPN11
LEKSIILDNRHKQTLVEHAKKYAPNESCALLFGKESSGEYIVKEVFLTKNTENSPINFTISNEELLRGYKDAEQKNLEVVGIFHSHPHSEAVPSATDKKFMEINPVVWLIFSNKSGDLAAYVLENEIKPVSVRLA